MMECTFAYVLLLSGFLKTPPLRHFCILLGSKEIKYMQVPLPWVPEAFQKGFSVSFISGLFDPRENPLDRSAVPSVSVRFWTRELIGFS